MNKIRDKVHDALEPLATAEDRAAFERAMAKGREVSAVGLLANYGTDLHGG